MLTAAATLATVARRARSIMLPLRNQVLELRHNPPPIPLRWAVVGLAAAVLIVFAARLEAAWRRDAWWRAEIARSSAEVRAILREAGKTIVKGDQESIEALKREKADAEAELELLRAARDIVPLSEACRVCRVPAERLNPGGLRQ